jgi:hypothetical protein
LTIHNPQQGKENAVDIIYAAVGYELLENDIHEADNW